VSRSEGDAEETTRVLIVEDSRTQAELLRAILVKHGFSPFVAENGRQALDIIGTVNPDVIISDVVMPVMDGYEFCRTVKNDERYRHIPVILLTMLADSKDIVYALVSGADNFITKPYQAEYLISRLRKIISAGKSPEEEAIPEPPFEISLSGKRFTITHDRRHILELLLSAYEAAVLQHAEVLASQKKLTEANDEANLYLDIITHDINNVNTGALALTELMLMRAAEGEKALAVRLLSNVNQSIEIIGNVSTIRRLHERREALSARKLDYVIRNEIHRYQSANITFNGTEVEVLADSLIGQIFMNLIGNSVKFAGAKAAVDIVITTKDDTVEVTIADNGPGIPDDMKPVIFDRFKRGKTTRSGKGLGLFIVRSLVESYGGRVWAEDVVPGKSDAGAAIHFTLKKAG
jgi:signal transduction histidine kinase